MPMFYTSACIMLIHLKYDCFIDTLMTSWIIGDALTREGSRLLKLLGICELSWLYGNTQYDCDCYYDMAIHNMIVTVLHILVTYIFR